MTQDSRPLRPQPDPQPDPRSAELGPQPGQQPGQQPDPQPDPPGPVPARLSAGTRRDPLLVRGGGPQDAVATVWYQLGYRPANSLVIIGLSGPGRRLGTMARGDLPGGASASSAARSGAPSGVGAGYSAGDRSETLLRKIVRNLYEPVAGTGTREVLAIVFSDRLFGQGDPPISASLIHSEVRRAGGRAVDVIGVTGERYRSLNCDSAGCCPRGGRPLSEVESSAAAAAHIVLGAEVLPGEADLLRDVQPVDDPVHDATAGPAPWSRSLTPASRRLQWLVWERAFNAGEIAEGRAASLAPYLDDPHLRDAVLVGALGVDRETILRALRHPHREHALDLYSALAVDPEEAEQATRLERVRVVFATAARFAAPGERAGALAILALIAWYRGQAARARLLVQAALADQPDQSLAGLVDQMLISAVPPPWRQLWGGPANIADQA